MMPWLASAITDPAEHVPVAEGQLAGVRWPPSLMVQLLQALMKVTGSIRLFTVDVFFDS